MANSYFQWVSPHSHVCMTHLPHGSFLLSLQSSLSLWFSLNPQAREPQTLPNLGWGRYGYIALFVYMQILLSLVSCKCNLALQYKQKTGFISTGVH